MIWKDVIGYEGSYQVSDTGLVKSLERKDTIGRVVRERILRAGVNERGYEVVALRRGGKSNTRKVHQLVAESFLNHKRCGLKIVVDHIDHNKLNNKAENLQLLTKGENISKGYKRKRELWQQD